ncbi:DUF1080 domain-containing protein [Flagellimonas sp. GZD32]|uniref:3-keto-disaccharide hydrolase n=1 Tax=Flagellimonas cixiensis TaxID=3228750 RepID=UPI0035C8904C
MKKFKFLFLFVTSLTLVVCLLGCKQKNKREAKAETEWVQLFNGKNLDNWTVKIHHYEVGDNFGDTFRVEDSILKVRYDQYQGDFNERYGHIYYDQPFSNYHLVVEYRFVDGWYDSAPSYTLLNSGLMFHSQDPRTMPKEQDWPISVEMQFLAEVTKGESRPTGNMCSPGTDVFFEGQIDPRHCINSTSETYPVGEWVRAELIVYGDSLITHKINGKKVLQYSKPQIGGDVANRYDESIKIDGTPLKEGFIALQSEGQAIDFRKVEIKVLEE